MDIPQSVDMVYAAPGGASTSLAKLRAPTHKGWLG